MKKYFSLIFHCKEISQTSELVSCLFNSSAWASVFNNQQQTIGIYNKANELIGLFNIFIGNKLGQKYIITPPYSTDIGLNVKFTSQNQFYKNKTIKNVLKVISEYLESQKVMFIDLVLPSEIIDVQPFIWSKFDVSVKYTYLLDIEKTEEELLAQMSSERRKNIKDAKKTVQFSKCTDSSLIFEKIEESLIQNEANYNSQIVKSIITNFPNDDNHICIKTEVNNKLASIHFIVKDSHTAYYLFGWSDKTESSISGTYGLWSTILEAKKQGVKIYNFAGSGIPSVEKYFRGFGGKLTPMFNIKKQNFIGKTLLKLK